MSSGSTLSAWKYWGAACLASALLSALAVRWLPDARPVEALLGWLLTGALAAAGYFFLPRALGPDTTRFLVFGLGNQFIRLGLLLACFVLLTWTEKTSTLGFVSSGLISYFTHLFAEISWLARATTGPNTIA